jgi:hypothetical protein
MQARIAAVSGNLLGTVLKILILRFAFNIQSGYVAVAAQSGNQLVLI